MAVRTKWRGCFLELIDGQLSDEQLQSLYERSINGSKEEVDDLIVQLVPAANRVVGRYRRYFGVVPADDMAAIAYAALPGALKAFNPNRGKGKLWHFAYVHVSGMVWAAIRTARRKKRIMPVCIGSSQEFGPLDVIVDRNRGPLESAEINDEVGLVSEFLSRRLQGNQRKWKYLARYYGVQGHNADSAPAIARDYGLTKMAIHLQIDRAIQTIRKELHVD